MDQECDQIPVGIPDVLWVSDPARIVLVKVNISNFLVPHCLGSGFSGSGRTILKGNLLRHVLIIGDISR